MGSKGVLAVLSSTVFSSFLLGIHIYDARLLALHSQCQVLLYFEGWNDVVCSVIMLCVWLCMKLLSTVNSLEGHCGDLNFGNVLCVMTTVLHNLVDCF
jgi:hypothetical protein